MSNNAGTATLREGGPRLPWDAQLISIERLHIGQKHLRRDQHVHVAELATSIARHGLLHPIVVERVPDGNDFNLIAGHRRLEAMRLLGWSQTPAYVLDRRSEFERLSIGIVENIQRENLSAAERREAYVELRRLMNGGTKAAAEMLGIHPASFRRALRKDGEDSIRRLSIGQSVRALEHWTTVAPKLDDSKRQILLQKATALVEALRGPD